MKTLTKGFTLIEMLVVILILSILAAMAYPSYANYTRNMRLDRARATIAKITQHLEQLYAKQGTFCTTTPCNIDVSDLIDDTAADTYTITVSPAPSQYSIYAEPKSGFYNNDILNTKKVYLVYYSQTTTFARCTASGFNSSKSNTDPGEQCEIL